VKIASENETRNRRHCRQQDCDSREWKTWNTNR